MSETEKEDGGDPKSKDRANARNTRGVSRQQLLGWDKFSMRWRKRKKKDDHFENR